VIFLGSQYGVARAHTILNGVGTVYAGLLHPLVAPAEALALIALGILLGTSGRTASRVGIPAVSLGVGAGLLMGQFQPLAAVGLWLPVASALSTAAVVIAGLRAPLPVAGAFALASGVAVGLDIGADSGGTVLAIESNASLVVGCTLVTLVTAGIVLGRDKSWQLIAARVASSWLAAISTLYLAWFIRFG
jgi:urease accessory protein